MKKSRIPGWLIAAGAIALLGVLGFSGYRAVSIWRQYREADDEYANLQALMNQTAAPTAKNTTASIGESLAAATASGDASVAVVSTSTAGETTSAPTLSAEGADAAPEPLIQMDFAPLFEINEDAVGWLISDGTVIDYPIVQGDDNAFYLDHLFSGKGGFAGTLFMDADNASDFSDRNTVVYGHHLNNGTMFASLSNYREQAYYDEHPVMYLYTPAGDYEIEIFSGYARSASSIPHDFDTPEDFMAYIDQITALSDFTTDIEVGPDDRIISLVTCSYVTKDARFVVHGKLVPLYAADGGDGT